MSLQRILLNLYLEYLNDYLTVAKFAEHNGMTEKDVKILLTLGAKYLEENADHYKQTGYELYL